MSNSCTAQLKNYVLPQGFSYDPYVPSIRRSSIATANAVIHQSASPSIVHGAGEISWRLTPAYPHEWAQLYALYNLDELMRFTGYWGDEYDVYFKMDQNSVRHRLFNGSGTMTVVCVISLPEPTCLIQ